MPVDQQEILQTAEKLGALVAQHPSFEKYKQAQKLVSEDSDASRLLSDFDRQVETLARQEQSGMPVTDAQRASLESLQSKIVSHIKVKALNVAQADFMDLLRKVSQTWQKPLAEGTAPTGAAGPQRMVR
jgi:cell fate (sporulation/competence/biofilm development) regulator YlbF (YheA/YmcA/DUF963 family)